MGKKKHTNKDNGAEGFKPTGDTFVDNCFSFDISPDNEDRLASKIEGLKLVPGLVKEKNYKQAWAILDSNQDSFLDFDFIYTWQAVILQKNKQINEARETLSEGLKHARARHVLCDRMGLLEFEADQMEDAVKWWIRSIALMLVSRGANMWEPFLYLAYVAKACGSQKSFDLLMVQVAKISPQGELGFEPEAEKLLLEKAKTLPQKSVISAVDLLCKTFARDMFQPSYRETAKEVKDPTLADKRPTSHSLPGKNEISPAETHPKNLEKKKKEKFWLALAGVIILFAIAYFSFSTSRESKSTKGDKGTKPPETALQEQPLSKTDLSVQQREKVPPPSVLVITPEITTRPAPVKEVKQNQTDKEIPHKEKTSGLKVKTKTALPHIKKKTE